MVKAVAQGAEIRGDGPVGRDFVQQVGLHFDELHDGVAAKPVPVEDERGVVLRGRGHRHRHLVPRGNNLSPMAEPHALVEAFDGFVFGFEPEMPFAARVFIERGLGEVAAEAVVNLPRDELRMAAQRPRHVFDEALGVIPIDIAVQTNGAARAFVFDVAVFVERENLRIFLGEPDGRGGGGRGQHHLNAVFAHHVHHALEPAKIILAVFGFAKPPGKFADADDVEAGSNHELRVLLPLGLGIFRRAAEGEDPLFGVVINAEIHSFFSRVCVKPP